MTQIATVTALPGPGTAEVTVARQTACGHDCEECAGCGVTGAAVHARARNPIGASPGQKVVVESSTQKMLRIVALVYLIPVALFFLGYFLAMAVTDSTAIQYTAAAAGFVLGILGAMGYDRRLRARGGLSFTIIRLF